MPKLSLCIKPLTDLLAAFLLSSLEHPKSLVLRLKPPVTSQLAASQSPQNSWCAFIATLTQLVGAPKSQRCMHTYRSQGDVLPFQPCCVSLSAPLSAISMGLTTVLQDRGRGKTPRDQKTPALCPLPSCVSPRPSAPP